MHKIRRKKKTSVCSDDGVGSDGEGDHKKHGHGKRRGSKKEEIHHLPTIDDETKPQVLIPYLSNYFYYQEVKSCFRI